MTRRRRRVRCWFCGNEARRVPSTRGVLSLRLDARGRIGVVARRRRVPPYGACGAQLGHGYVCGEPMLLRRDARMVLRAALEHERRGGNARSEYDR